MHRRLTRAAAVVLLLSSAGVLGGAPAGVGAPPLPADCPQGYTNWVDFVGQQSTLNGVLLPVGAIIRAYNPAGTIVGCARVSQSGFYLAALYEDNPDTPGLDGAQPGDSIAFTVDHHQALPRGPDAPIWTTSPPGNDGRVDEELEACTLPGDFDCDCRVTTADLMRQARALATSRSDVGYYPPLDRDGDDDIDPNDVQLTASAWGDTCGGE